MADRLNGKISIVTGAGSGMGRAVALEYLKEGCKVVAMARRVERLESLMDEAKELGLGDSLVIISGDVTSAGDCDKAVAAAVKAFGSLNVLTHFAGVVDYMNTVDEITDEDWERVININLTGSMKISRACLRYFRENKIRASMVMCTSNCALEGATSGAAYVASKGGAESLAQCMAFEYGRDGIRVNTIQPGPFATSIAADPGWAPKAMEGRGLQIHQGSGYNKDARDWALSGEWLTDKYLVAQPKHITGAAVYLASDESAFVNAASLKVDGGICLG